jgi:hypothetical protein
MAEYKKVPEFEPVIFLTNCLISDIIKSYNAIMPEKWREGFFRLLSNFLPRKGLVELYNSNVARLSTE